MLDWTKGRCRDGFRIGVSVQHLRFSTGSVEDGAPMKEAFTKQQLDVLKQFTMSTCT